MYLGGDAVVIGNSKSSGDADNLYISDYGMPATAVKLGTSTNGSNGNGVAKPKDGFKVGVSKYNQPTQGSPVDFAADGDSDYITAEYFTADKKGCYITIDSSSGNMQLGYANVELIDGTSSTYFAGDNSIADALAAASSSSQWYTVKLIDDFTESPTVSNAQHIIFDLNNCKLSGKLTVDNDSALVKIDDSSSDAGGKISNTDNNAIDLERGKIELLGGTVSSSGSSAVVLYVSPDAGSFTVNGGTVYSNLSYAFTTDATTAGKIVVNDGAIDAIGLIAFTGTEPADGVVIINGGKIHSDLPTVDNKPVLIRGGFFIDYPTKYLDSNYVVFGTDSDTAKSILTAKTAGEYYDDGYLYTVFGAVLNVGTSSSYTSIAAAIANDAANDTTELKLFGDLTETFVLNSATAKTVEIDLNGKTLSSAATVIKIDGKDNTAVLTDSSSSRTGKIVSTSSLAAYPAVNVVNGELELETNVTCSSGVAVKVGNGGALTCDNATVIGAVGIESAASGKKDVIIRSSSVEGSEYAVKSTDTVKYSVMIYGSFSTYVKGALSETTEHAIAVKGGYFSVDPTDYTYVVSGEAYGVLDNTETSSTVYPYAVRPAVAIDDSWFYSSLESAMGGDGILGIYPGETVKLYNNIIERNTISADCSAVLDLNGFAITVDDDSLSSDYLFDVKGTGNSLTVKDTSTEKTGKIICNKADTEVFHVTDSAELLVQGGTIEGVTAIGADGANKIVLGGDSTEIKGSKYVLDVANVAVDVAITGGYYNGAVTSQSATIVASGGWYTVDPSAAASKIIVDTAYGVNNYPNSPVYKYRILEKGAAPVVGTDFKFTLPNTVSVSDTDVFEIISVKAVAYCSDIVANEYIAIRKAVAENGASDKAQSDPVTITVLDMSPTVVTAEVEHVIGGVPEYKYRTYNLDSDMQISKDDGATWEDVPGYSYYEIPEYKTLWVRYKSSIINTPNTYAAEKKVDIVRTSFDDSLTDAQQVDMKDLVADMLDNIAYWHVTFNGKLAGYTGYTGLAHVDDRIISKLGMGGYVDIKLLSTDTVIKSDASSTATATELVFDVTPYSGAGIAIHKVAGGVTFRLPVPSDESYAYANVYHEGVFIGQYEVKEIDIPTVMTIKYIDVTGYDFSKYSYKLTNVKYVAPASHTNPRTEA